MELPISILVTDGLPYEIDDNTRPLSWPVTIAVLDWPGQTVFEYLEARGLYEVVRK